MRTRAAGRGAISFIGSLWLQIAIGSSIYIPAPSGHSISQTATFINSLTSVSAYAVLTAAHCCLAYQPLDPQTQSNPEEFDVYIDVILSAYHLYYNVKVRGVGWSAPGAIETHAVKAWVPKWFVSSTEEKRFLDVCIIKLAKAIDVLDRSKDAPELVPAILSELHTVLLP